MTGWLALLLHAALLALAAPMLEALAATVAAVRARQTPPPLTQPVRDLVRLWRKPSLVPPGASFVFAGGPAVALAAAITAALLAPAFTLDDAAAGASDLIVVAGLLGLSRAALALSAHDSMAAWPTFRAGRMMVARLGAEPVLLLVALAAALLSGGTGLHATAAALRDGGGGAHAAGLLAGAAVLFAAAADRSPFDVGHTGQHRALIVLTGQMRRLALLSVAAALALPFGFATAPLWWLPAALGWALKLAGLAVLAGFIDGTGLALPAAAALALVATLVAAVQAAA